MNKTEKIKLKIEKLKSRSDFHKWEYGQYTNYLIGSSAILIALLVSKAGDNLLFVGIIILLIFIFYLLIKSSSKKSEYKIKRLSKEIEKNYNQLENI